MQRRANGGILDPDLIFETLPLGEHVLVHNPASGAMIICEPSATRLLAAFAVSGRQDAPELGADDREILTTWEAAGLFETRRRAPEVCLPRAPDAGKQRLRFQGRAGVAEIVTADAPLMDQLACLLAPYGARDAGAARHSYVFEADGTRYTAYDGDVPVTEYMTRDEARYLAARYICEAISGVEQVATTFHAASVGQAGRALILVGESGRGKTTTALGLLSAGCAQVADDHLPLHRNGREVLAFPAAIGTKAGTWDLPEGRWLFDTARELPAVRDGVRYAMTEGYVPQGTPLEVAGLVFPNHTPGADLKMERLSPEEAFFLSVEAGARISPGLATAQALVHLLNTVPCLRMTYATSAQSVPACLAVLEG